MRRRAQVRCDGMRRDRAADMLPATCRLLEFRLANRLLKTQPAAAIIIIKRLRGGLLKVKIFYCVQQMHSFPVR